MELPHIGEQCSENSCRKLDFLPFTCNLCNKVFCSDHQKYDDHNCPDKYKIDARVPICPLCNQAVPSKRGETPDLAVNEHMENNCKNKKNKSYINKCSLKGCKTKEVIQLKCDSCTLNYCVKHRHAADHDCRGPATRREIAANAAKNRSTLHNMQSSSSGGGGSNNRSPTSVNENNTFTSSIKKYLNVGSRPAAPSTRQATTIQVQGTMSEDEALARALAESAMSMNNQESNHNLVNGAANPPNEEEDAMLARAIAASLEEEGRSSRRSNKSDNCHIC